jgi:adenine deaminase
MTIHRATSAVLLALLPVLAGCGERVKDRLALVGGNVVDVSDGSITRNAVVVIYQGHIETVTAADGFDIPKSAEVLDVTGRYLIPGLIDAHAHVKPPCPVTSPTG